MLFAQRGQRGLAQQNEGRVVVDRMVQPGAHVAMYSELHDSNGLKSTELCGPCHDIVNAHDTPIERTFAEWKDSVFATSNVPLRVTMSLEA